MYCREHKDVRALNSVETTATDSHIGTLAVGTHLRRCFVHGVVGLVRVARPVIRGCNLLSSQRILFRLTGHSERLLLGTLQNRSVLFWICPPVPLPTKSPGTNASQLAHYY